MDWAGAYVDDICVLIRPVVHVDAMCLFDTSGAYIITVLSVLGVIIVCLVYA